MIGYSIDPNQGGRQSSARLLDGRNTLYRSGLPSLLSTLLSMFFGGADRWPVGASERLAECRLRQGKCQIPASQQNAPPTCPKAGRVKQVLPVRTAPTELGPSQGPSCQAGVHTSPSAAIQVRPDFQCCTTSYRVRQSNDVVEESSVDWSVAGMEYSRTDVVLLIITTLVVAAVLLNIAFGPMQWS
jgi:hypothetical protein